MKTLLVSALILLFSSIGIQAQKEDHKKFMDAFPDPSGFEKMHGLSSGGNKFGTRQPGLPRIPTSIHLKSIAEQTQLLDSTIVEYLNPTSNGGGTDKSKTIYTYDASGHMTQYIIYFWYGNQYGKPEGFKGFSYDAGGKLTSDSSYNCYGIPEHCINTAETYYTYNEDGNVISSSFYYDGKYERNVFSYDASGHLSEAVSYLPNRDTSKLDYGYKSEYEYDDSEFENLIKEKYFYRDNNTSKWIYSGWDDITYDDNGNITLLMSYANYTNLDLPPNPYKLETVYDAYGNITTIGSSWFSLISKWAPNYKQTDYYSQHDITGMPAIPERKIGVNPNPAYDYVKFDGINVAETAKVELFDLETKMLLEQKLPANRQIKVGILNKGQYLHRLKNNNII